MLSRLRAALCASVAASALVLAAAAPAAAQAPTPTPVTTPVGTISSVSATGGGGGVSVTSDSAVTTIAVLDRRVVLNFDQFVVPAGHTVHFQFATSTDAALIRIVGRWDPTANGTGGWVPGSASIGGVVRATIGAAMTGTGGGLFLSSPSGVLFGNASETTGGAVVATTGDITDAGFFAGGHPPFAGQPPAPFNVADAAASVEVHGQAKVIGSDVTALLSQLVVTSPDTTVGAGNPEVETVFGGADDFSVGLDARGSGFDLLNLIIPPGGASAQAAPLQVGSADSGRVYLASASTVAGSVFAKNLSSVRDVVINTAGGFTRNDGDFVATPVPTAGAAVQGAVLGSPFPRVSGGPPQGLSSGNRVHVEAPGKITVDGPVEAGSIATLDSEGDVEIGGAGRVTSSAPAVAAGDDFVNLRGADAVSVPSYAAPGSHWVVYAGDTSGNTYGGLDSGNTALWNGTLASRPPSAVSGNRYVFGSQPTLTFTSEDESKYEGRDVSGALDHSVSGYQAGVAGAFLGDTASTAFSGAPALSSAGAGAAATPGVYGIDIALGSLTSPAGYAFSFAGTGDLTVLDDTTPPVVTKHVSGTEGENGWHTSDVTLTWDTSDDETDVTSTSGCDDQAITTDGSHPFACTATSLGGEKTESVTIKRDATAPTIDVSATSGSAPYVAGTTAPGDVVVSFACTDGGSGVDTTATTLTSTRTITDEGTTSSVGSTGACVDLAGNTASPASFGPVVIERDGDADGFPDARDNCPGAANAGQDDVDDDGLGDACDPVDDRDADDDGVRDGLDNCPSDANANQADVDDDGIGDACDPVDDRDGDQDGVLDTGDNCPSDANAGQGDLDGDGAGDVCDPDRDGDGVMDADDNCPENANGAQADTDGDGLGDACDPLSWRFVGFFAPVNNEPTVNVAKAGSAIPVKFGLSGDRGLAIMETGYPKSRRVDCETSVPLDLIETTTNATGGGISYDRLTDTYTYVWKTERTWGGHCRELTVKTRDGGVRQAAFRLR